jgi:hypothetical protein
VINDSKAFQYIGKAVEMRGLVFAFPFSPLGSAYVSSDENTPVRRSPGSFLTRKKA